MFVWIEFRTFLLLFTFCAGLVLLSESNFNLLSNKLPRSSTSSHCSSSSRSNSFHHSMSCFKPFDESFLIIIKPLNLYLCKCALFDLPDNTHVLLKTDFTFIIWNDPLK